jgi:hypothetical protein
VSQLSYLDVRAILVKVADLKRELVLVGGQAVNFWASYYASAVWVPEEPTAPADRYLPPNHTRRITRRRSGPWPR